MLLCCLFCKATIFFQKLIIKAMLVRYNNKQNILPMTDIYTYFYSINTNEKNRTEEYLLNIKEMADFEKTLNFLPEISPSDCLVKKILELA